MGLVWSMQAGVAQGCCGIGLVWHRVGVEHRGRLRKKIMHPPCWFSGKPKMPLGVSYSHFGLTELYNHICTQAVDVLLCKPGYFFSI